MAGEFEEWSQYILKELTRHNELLEKHNDLLSEIRTQIAMLQVKSGIWGAIGGAIPVAIGLAIWLIKSKSGN